MSKNTRGCHRNNSFIGDEHGAVTVYTILIIVPIFIFQAVLIDFVRIKVATMEAEQALRAATRSVLSTYDRQLLPYGLFGVKANAEEQKSIANDVLSRYGTDGDRVDTFKWVVLNTLQEQTTIAPLYTLGDHRLFHQQILEDMKYKAPIEFSRNLYHKWKDKKEIVEEADEVVNVAEEIEALLEQREQQLESAYNLVKQMNNRASSLHTAYTSSDSENLSSLVSNDLRSLQEQFNNMSDYVREAEQIEQNIRQQWDEDTDGLLNDIYILGSEYYSSYIVGATVPISAFGAFLNQVSSLQEGESASGLSIDFYDSFQRWFDIRSNEESRRTAAYKNIANKKKEQRKKVDDQLDQTKKTVMSQVCPNGSGEQYDQLKSYYQNYLKFNNSSYEQEFDSGSSLDQSPDQYKSSSMSFLTSLTDVMESIRDEAYVNEYIMYNFNHRTLSEQSSKSPLESQLNQHVLQAQEVEYILYGLSSCTANRIAAYSEIYMLRFAIRMIEALTDARKAAVGSPLLIVLIAAAEGGIKAYQDMERIINGEDVPVFAKWGALTMNYADYLRMFLMIHSREERKLSRIQALIQLNTQTDLLFRPAYIELKSVMTMNLWFIRGREYQIKKTAAMSY